jgi:hypothetical protein
MISERRAPGALSLDFEAAKKILVGDGQTFVNAPGALTLKMRFFLAQGNEGLPVVSVAHKSVHSCRYDAVRSPARSVERQLDAASLPIHN